MFAFLGQNGNAETVVNIRTQFLGQIEFELGTHTSTSCACADRFTMKPSP